MGFQKIFEMLMFKVNVEETLLKAPIGVCPVFLKSYQRILKPNQATIKISAWKLINYILYISVGLQSVVYKLKLSLNKLKLIKENKA